MAYEVITLNLIPSGEVPVIHAAQFDVNRPLMFALKLGDDDFDPSTYSLELQLRKVDNTIVTAAPASTSGNVVTFNSTEQMTACSGTNLGEIQITKGDLDIATLHFYLVVQRDVLAGGVSSASDIHNLTEQIAEIVPQVIGDDYYTKEEVDEKIDEIPTFDPTNYYDKSETDALLDDKADVSDLPDMSNYYDKSETDTLLSNKADKSVVDAIKLLPTVKSASGSVATFNTDIIDTLLNCIVNSSATNITRCGKNFVAFSPMTVITQTRILDNIYLPKGDYVFSIDVDNTTNIAGSFNIRIGTTSIGTVGFVGNYQGRVNKYFTLAQDSTINIVLGGASAGYSFNITNAQIELGDTASTFESFNGTTYSVADKDTITTLNGLNNIYTDNGDISVKYLETIGHAIS